MTTCRVENSPSSVSLGEFAAPRPKRRLQSCRERHSRRLEIAATDSVSVNAVRCTDDELIVSLADGRTLAVPIVWFPRLAKVDPPARADYELLGQGEGIHWSALDEDISVAGLLAGRPSAEFGRRGDGTG